MTQKYLVSTDLDGTLLDHHTYSWQAASKALQECHEKDVPVVINTSKAQSEVRSLLADLGFSAPFVIENGSALFIPVSMVDDPATLLELDAKVHKSSDYFKVVFGAERRRILEFIDQVRSQFDWSFEGFSDWTVAQISEITGLSLDAAGQASQKHYSEPFIWNDTDENLQALIDLATESGLRCMKGGRFYHLQGQTTKAVPIQWLMKNSDSIFGNGNSNCARKLICLGDNHNDVDMLNIADFPVCVRSPIADYPNLSTQKEIIRTTLYGPEGWANAIHSILA